MTRTAKRPVKLSVNLNCLFPRWTCSVTDGVGTAYGGFWKGFKSHADLYVWLEKHRYSFALVA